MRRSLKKWSKELGFSRIKNIAFGELGGYLITICQGGAECTLYVDGFFQDVNQKSRMGQMLHNPGVLKENGFLGVLFYENKIAFQFSGNKKSIEKMKRFLNWLIPALRQEGFSDNTVCSFCRQPIAEQDGAYVLSEDCVAKVHEQCVERMKDPAMIGSAEQYQKSYGRGFSFSLLFSLLGAVPAIYLNIFGWYSGFLSMLIVFMAYKGYEISRAKREKPAIWIIGLTSFLGISFSLFVGALLQELAGVSKKLNPGLNIYMAFMMGFVVFLICGKDIYDMSNSRKIKHIDKNRYKKK